MIEKTLLYSNNISTNVLNLANWLRESAVPDYFSKIEVNVGTDMHEIVCYENDVERLHINFGATLIKSLVFDTEVGTQTVTTNVTSPMYAAYGYKLSGGLVIQLAGADCTCSSNHCFAITKDSGGNTALVTSQYMEQSSTVRPVYAVTKNTLSQAIEGCFISAGSSYAKTVLCPIMIDDADGRTLPYLFATPYSQYYGVFGIVEAVGKKGISTGGWILFD